MASQTDPPFDRGGILPAGLVHLPASTMRPERRLSPEQTRAYLRAAELVDRWHRRGES